MNTKRGLRFAVIASLFWHLLMFNSIEFSFGRDSGAEDFKSGRIFFLGSILGEANSYDVAGKSPVSCAKSRLKERISVNMARRKLPLVSELEPGTIIFKKPSTDNLTENKIFHIRDIEAPESKDAQKSLMFYPLMPYHFLLYFKNRQTAHMEVAFYVSDEGKIAGIKRKISSGNPEVDLLIMRNLTHFLNLYKSNFKLGSWQTVKIDLSP